MKKFILILLLLPLLGLVSCVKQNSSSRRTTGEILYLENPQFDICGNVISALFTANDYYMFNTPVAGKIPKEFQSKDKLKVWIKFRTICDNEGFSPTIEIINIKSIN